MFKIWKFYIQNGVQTFCWFYFTVKFNTRNSFFQLINRIYEGSIKEYSTRRGPNYFLHGGLKHSEYIRGLLDFENTNAYEFRLIPGPDESLFLNWEFDYWNGRGNTTKDYNKWHYRSPPLPYRRDLSARGGHIRRYLRSFKVYHFHDTSESSAMKQIGSLDENNYLREDAGNLAAFLYFLQEKHANNFKRIEMAIRSIATFFERFDLKPRQLNVTQIKLEWKERDSDMYMDAHNLSDGTLRFMALATLLLQPDPPKTIIIDEPELGLHPFAIQKLAALIQKVSVASQVIVSTQSVEFVNQFNPEDVITVDREERQSVFQRLEREDLQHWLDSFALGDIWQKNIIGGQP